MSEDTPATTTTALLDAPKPIRDFSRLSRADEALILKLHADGRKQVEIAQLVGCSQPTVSTVINSFTDTREAAKARLNNSAVALAERVIRKANVDQALEVLDRLEVAPKRDTGKSGVQVNILSAGALFGVPGSSAP